MAEQIALFEEINKSHQPINLTKQVQPGKSHED